jgi:tRNA 5-methylaminomethyl-2-thiouridine biosynthesis bifunctional protein
VPSTAAPHWRLRDAQGNEVARCGQVILANAAAIGELLQTAWLPVHSVRGQLSLLTANYSTAGNHAYSFERFIAPALDKDNHYYCGAGYQVEDLPAHGDVALRMNDQQANLEFVERYFPGLFSVADGLQGRAGYRAVSDDRLPVAGAVPDSAWFEAAYHDLRHGRPAQQYASARHLPGLYVSSAHGSRGLVSSFICGEHIAALMESTPLPLSQRLSDAINPARFLIRKLRRGD